MLGLAAPPVAGAEIHLSISLSSTNYQAGTEGMSFTVEARDDVGALVADYRNTILVTSTDANAVISGGNGGPDTDWQCWRNPGCETFTDADAGQHTFTVVFNTTGAQLTAEDTSNPARRVTKEILGIDLCANVSGARDMTIKPKVTVSKINSDTDTTNDGLTISGEFISATSFDALDPQTNGARLVLANAVGTTKVAVILDGGAYGGKGTRGWTVNGKRTKWTYRDKTGAPTNGITKMVIQDRSKKAPNR